MKVCQAWNSTQYARGVILCGQIWAPIVKEHTRAHGHQVFFSQSVFWWLLTVTVCEHINFKPNSPSFWCWALLRTGLGHARHPLLLWQINEIMYIIPSLNLQSTQNHFLDSLHWVPIIQQIACKACHSQMTGGTESTANSNQFTPQQIFTDQN